jgi:hypothetical protein
MRLLEYALCLGCALVLSNPISAQTPQPVPQPARPQTQPAQTNFFPQPLYQMNNVTKSLNLTQDQINGLNKLTDRTQALYNAKYNALNSLNDAERFTRLQELNRQYTRDWNKGARDIFNDNQRSRFQQFNYQYGGFNALFDPAVQKQLDLTPNQIKDLRAQADWSNKQLQEISRVGATDPAKGRHLYRDYWKQRQERFNKFLTPEQQRIWSELIGEPFAFQPTFAQTR